jgi:hypothetical protein
MYRSSFSFEHGWLGANRPGANEHGDFDANETSQILGRRGDRDTCRLYVPDRRSRHANRNAIGHSDRAARLFRGSDRSAFGPHRKHSLAARLAPAWMARTPLAPPLALIEERSV